MFQRCVVVDSAVLRVGQGKKNGSCGRGYVSTADALLIASGMCESTAKDCCHLWGSMWSSVDADTVEAAEEVREKRNACFQTTLQCLRCHDAPLARVGFSIRCSSDSGKVCLVNPCSFLMRTCKVIVDFNS